MKGVEKFTLWVPSSFKIQGHVPGETGLNVDLEYKIALLDLVYECLKWRSKTSSLKDSSDRVPLLLPVYPMLTESEKKLLQSTMQVHNIIAPQNTCSTFSCDFLSYFNKNETACLEFFSVAYTVNDTPARIDEEQHLIHSRPPLQKTTQQYF